MLDDLDRLRQRPALTQLLSHYSEVGSIDREAWQVRCTALEGVNAKGLTWLHGELIAFAWIELAISHGQASDGSAFAKCYRITNSGVRALRRVTNGRSDGDDMPEAA